MTAAPFIAGTFRRTDGSPTINDGSAYTDLMAPAAARSGDWQPYVTSTGTGWANDTPGWWELTALTLTDSSQPRYEELLTAGTFTGTVGFANNPAGFSGLRGSVVVYAPRGIRQAWRYYKSGPTGTFRGDTRWSLRWLGPVDVPPTTGKLAVYGDSFAADGTVWGSGDPVWGWPSLVADRNGLELTNNAIGGTGYRQVAHGTSIPYAAATAPAPGADVVAVFGSLNDKDQDPEAVRQAAVCTYTLLRAKHPHARILAIGPQWAASSIPAPLLAIRAAVADAAATCGATHVDALGWFQGHPDLIGSDGLHPNRAGHAHLADLIHPHVAAALSI